MRSVLAPWILRIGAVLCGAAALCALPAQAQVVRCTDARSGQVTYTDSVCATGESSHEVEARKSAQELANERTAGQAAAERLRERLAAEAEAEQRKEAREASKERARRDAPTDYAHSADCANARRQLKRRAINQPPKLR